MEERISYKRFAGSKTMPGSSPGHLPTSAGHSCLALLQENIFSLWQSIHKKLFRVLGEGGSRSSLCSLVRVLESDCLALLHTQTSLRHLAQCSQLQEVTFFPGVPCFSPLSAISFPSCLE